MRHRSRCVPRPLLVAALAVALLTGCGSAGTASDDASPPAPTATTPVETLETPNTADVPEELDFTATTLDGDSFEGASLAGAPAVLWFWAPWCPVCAREAPLIADLADQYSGRVTFVGVAGLSGDAAAMQRFVSDGEVDEITHLDDRDGAIYAHFGVTQQYDIGFVTADGTVEIVTGPLSEGDITAEVERLAGG